MPYTLDQLRKATLDDLKSNPELANTLGQYYTGFSDGKLEAAGSGNVTSAVQRWISGERDFNYDKQYAIRNFASASAGGDRNQVQEFYGDGEFAAKDTPAFYAPKVTPTTASDPANRTQQLLDQSRALLSSFSSPYNASTLAAGTKPGPTLPTPTGPAATLAFAGSLEADVAAKRTAVESTYKTQIQGLDKKIADSEARINDFASQQEDEVLPEIEKLMQPFREAKETSERERLKVEENYFANQKLVEELEGLLTTLQSEVKAEEAVTGLASIRSPRVAKIKDEVAGRVGVIEAVMSSRSGQIAEAYRLIDRSVDAIAADRKDRLAYYETLYNFYEGQKDSEGKKLLSLDTEKKKFLDAQIGLIESDLQSAQATADYVKELMIDPKTALTAAQAGITLNDSIATINAKLAKQGATEQKAALINDMSAKGYQYLATPGQLAGKPSYQLVTQVDTQGNTLTFWDTTAKLATGSAGGLTGDQKELLAGYLGEVGAYATREEALAELNRFQAKIKLEVGQAGYNQIASEIDRLFPPPAPAAPPTPMAPKNIAIEGDRRDALPEDRRSKLENTLTDFLFK